jgi:hypothetical protein
VHFRVFKNYFDVLQPVVCLQSGIMVPSTQLFKLKQYWYDTFVLFIHYMFRTFTRSSSGFYLIIKRVDYEYEFILFTSYVLIRSAY